MMTKTEMSNTAAVTLVCVATLLLTVSGCATVDKMMALDANDGYDLPVVEDPVSAATIQVKSNPNPTDVQFLHLLKIDGETIMKLAENDLREFQLDPGSYALRVTCHRVPDPDLSSFPVNLRVSDGADTMQLTVLSDSDTCLKISKPILTCAKVEQVASSFCR